jgi:colanic acid biosynthesis glycosyl transferase WcaI
MHILLLNEYYPPDTSATAKQAATFAEALARRHRVTVLAGRPSYDPTEFYPWRLLRRETRGNITVERVGSTAYPRFQMRRRVANYLTYAALATIRGLIVRSDIVVCMTDPPFEGLIGALVAKLSGRPFVYNIQDLYPEMAVGGNIVRPSAAVRLWERLHCRALKSARRVIVIGDDMRDRIIDKGVAPACVAVVRAGVRTSPSLANSLDPPSRPHPVEREIRGGFRFVALHAGNLGFYGAWDTLLDAGRLLGDDGLGLVFVGDGAQKGRLMTQAAGTPAVRFLPFRPANEVPYVLSAGDVHLITVKRGLEGVIVPSKLYPILAAGKPVLVVAAPGADVARIITKAGCGFVIDPEDAPGLAAAIRLLSNQPDRVAEMGRRARAIAPEYDQAKQLEIFVDILEGVLHE